MDLRPHQLEASEKLSNGKILWGGVGTGKSMTAVHYYITKEAPKDVIVITTAKKRDSLDWEKEFARYGVGTRRNGTVAGLLTVDSWNNLFKYRTTEGAFFIFDEQRLVGSGEWAKVFLHVARRNRWILLTATPGDTWLDYVPVFVANGFYKNRTEFKRQHVVYSAWSRFPKVERYVEVGRLVRHRNALLVEMAYEKHTVRRHYDITVAHDKELFKKVVKDRWNVYENRPLRDVAELFAAMRKVVNSDPSRISAVQELMKEHPRMIVFYNFDYELFMLRAALSDAGSDQQSNVPTPSISQSNHTPSSILAASKSTKSSKLDSSSSSPKAPQSDECTLSEMTTMESSGNSFQIAEWNGHKHQPIPTSDSWVYLVQYVAGAEGWNCIETDTVLFYSLPYSYKIWEQAHGRIDRLNTPYKYLNYYILKSDSIIDKAVWNSLSNKKSFNESHYTGMKGGK